jgi:hypothetical protein
MRLTRSRRVALVAFAWLLTSLAATAAVSRDRFDSGSPGEGTPAAATPPPQASARAAAQGDWMAKYRPDCSAPWVVASDPFAFFTGAYGEFVVTVAVAILPALSCGLEGGA